MRLPFGKQNRKVRREKARRTRGWDDTVYTKPEKRARYEKELRKQGKLKVKQERTLPIPAEVRLKEWDKKSPQKQKEISEKIRNKKAAKAKLQLKKSLHG